MTYIKTHLPCPCGKSSDAFSVRADGSGFCFGTCGGKNFSKGKLQGDTVSDSADIEYDYISFRGISERVARFYGVQSKFVDGNPVSRAFPYGGAALKVKGLIDNDTTDKKDIKCIGEFKDAGFFGQDKFDPGSRPSVTLFEGEEDAMSGEEILGRKTASLSLKSGAGSAYSDCMRNYEYLNSFDRIYICFDADEPGKNALKSIMGLFDFRKVYHVQLGKHKDCNAYLRSGDADDFEKSWSAAKRYAPDTIISSFSDIEKALRESREDVLGSYPFTTLNEKLYGIHAGEIIVIKAPEGVGKTEFLRAIEYHWLKTTEYALGIIHLEEDNATTIKALAGYELQAPATLPDCGLSEEDILRGYRRAVGDDEGRVHIHAAFNVEEENAFYGTIRYLAALGVKLIAFDHISWMGTGLTDENPTEKLDRISQTLKLLAKELRIAILEVSHVNDDGLTRGSRNISKAANTVISLDRDLEAESLWTDFMIHKARLGGRTGPGGRAYFDRVSGTLIDETLVSGLLRPEEQVSMNNERKDRF
jgi:twinkle protein